MRISKAKPPPEDWRTHIVRAGPHRYCADQPPNPADHRRAIEPWLSALFQADHLNLLAGSGFTTAIAAAAGAPQVSMEPVTFECPHANAVRRSAEESAERLRRGKPNLEDQLRVMNELIAGLRVLTADGEASDGSDFLGQATAMVPRWESALASALSSLARDVLQTERGIAAALTTGDPCKARVLRELLEGFLLPFGSRAPTRERAHVFTTNYDRLVEYGCDLLGLRILDRFVGTLSPVFHSSRLGIDMHYNPPGIRGEARYLEGVVRLTKLHGSLDWKSAIGPSGRLEIQRSNVAFGAPADCSQITGNEHTELLIYPNAAKDVETLQFPYADLFRDFAAAICRPNAILVTYGYGFGDDHVNRALRDMLTIPSSHLVIISYDDHNGRLRSFCQNASHDAQVSLLLGPHFGDLRTLVENYLPKPAIDRATLRMAHLLNRRQLPGDGNDQQSGPLS